MKIFKLLWISFLSVFPTSKLLENVEADIEKIFDDSKKKKPQAKPAANDSQENGRGPEGRPPR